MNTDHDKSMDSSNDMKSQDRDILIVDDEIPNLQLLTQFLSAEGYQVRPAERPQLAIESALAKPPSLILLDVRMPEMDGFEVCERLKQDERTHDIPVIFVSALQDVQDRVRGFEAGGVDFISKPFQEAEVLARVRTHMDLRRMQLHLEELVAERTAELGAEIIERKRAGEALSESEAKYRNLVDNSIVGVFTTTYDGRFTFINEALVGMFDFDNTDQMMDSDSLSLWSNSMQRERMLAVLQECGIVTNFEAEFTTHTGRHLDVLFSARLEGDSISGMAMNITERKQAENKLKEYQQRLKSLAVQLTLAEEQERRRIAADLHDHVGQSLTLARLQLAIARKGLPKNDKQDAQFDDMSQSLMQAIQDTRHLIFELSSPTLNELGLAAAIDEWMEEQIATRHGIKTEFLDHSQAVTLDADLRAILFRNVRELLTNVIKHAQAKSISVSLEETADHLDITIQDDGVGFDFSEALRDINVERGFGLFSIQERMIDLGGKLTIVSQPGTGCRAVLHLPLNAQNPEIDA
jgi:PAS domain S-box-containing protein